ncbi:hypothetical protein LTR10_012768 [Elasticomyces elasticus]|nr:hypothetical protein LTR10_012768 [Elasticomyces elasticus]
MALLTGGIVKDLLKDGYDDHVIATAVAFICGLYGLAIDLFKLGFLLDFIPLPVLSGYVSAAALTIVIQQVPSLLAEKFAGTSTAEEINGIFGRLPDTKWRDFLIGFFGIVMLTSMQWIGRTWGKRYRALWFLSICRNAFALILFTGISYGINKDLKRPLFQISQTKGAGLKPPTTPDFALVGKVATRAIAVYIAAALEHLEIGKSFGRRHGYTIDQSQEVSLLVSSISLEVTGGFSRTAVNSESGVKSPLCGVVASACVLVSIYKLAGAFYWIPKATLSAIVICAVFPIILSPRVFYQYWKTSFADFVGSMVSFWVTLFVSVEYGIAAAVGYSLVYILLRIAFTRVVHITPANISTVYSNLPQGGTEVLEANILEGTQIYQINESILFPNAYQIKSSILNQVKLCSAGTNTGHDERDREENRLWNQPRATKSSVRSSNSDRPLPILKEVILDVRGVNYIDTTGIQALHDLKADLQVYAGRSMLFTFASMNENVRRRFMRAGWTVIQHPARRTEAEVEEYQGSRSGDDDRVRDGGDVVFDFLQTALQGRKKLSHRPLVESPGAEDLRTGKMLESKIDLEA